MLADLRFALRTFRRSPGLIAAAVPATALGVGANTAIFSVIQAVLLRPLPYRDSARLVSSPRRHAERYCRMGNSLNPAGT
jgi:putative ABC transport system permease protein